MASNLKPMSPQIFNQDNTSSLNQTKAFIASSATVNAGRDLTVEAEDTTETILPRVLLAVLVLLALA